MLSTAIALEALLLSGPTIVVQDLQGHSVKPLEIGRDKATVFLFISHDCPVSNGYAPEIGRIYERFHSKGIGFNIVYVDPNTPSGVLADHAKSFHLDGVLLKDPKHLLCHRLKATITPEAVLVSPGQSVLYRGRIDDAYLTLGRRRPIVTRHDLSDAIEQTLSSKPVLEPRTQAVGCYITEI